MPIRPLRRINTRDRGLYEVQTNINEVLNQLIIADFINGNLITATVGTSDTSIEHKLVRQFKGWVIVDKTDNVNVWRVEDGKDKTKFITLKASAGCTVTIYVF